MKVNQELQEDEADYLFHEFDFQQLKTSTDVDENENTNQLSKDQDNRATPETEISIAPPIPPLVPFLQPTANSGGENNHSQRPRPPPLHQ
jgi:hypothetical protein